MNTRPSLSTGSTTALIDMDCRTQYVTVLLFACFACVIHCHPCSACVPMPLCALFLPMLCTSVTSVLMTIWSLCHVGPLYSFARCAYAPSDVSFLLALLLLHALHVPCCQKIVLQLFCSCSACTSYTLCYCTLHKCCLYPTMHTVPTTFCSPMNWTLLLMLSSVVCWSTVNPLHSNLHCNVVQGIRQASCSVHERSSAYF